jgi:hypothetical protein
MIESILNAAQEMVAIARQIAEEWQSQIDLLIEPKGLRLGLSKGPIVVMVAGLTIVPSARKLYAATHGQSAWLLNLP